MPTPNAFQIQTAILKAIRQSGVFITSGKGEQANVISTHWGTLGVLWNRPVFILPVRQDKLTRRLIDENKCFAVSAPIKDMSKEIEACDRLSGHDINKFEELHLHPKRARAIPAYTISECGLFLECRVILTSQMEPENIDKNLFEEMYSEKGLHTIFFAEIVDCYDINE